MPIVTALTEANVLKTNENSRAAQAFEKSLATRPAGKYILWLFVAGATARSHQAVLRVRQLCEAELKDNVGFH